MENENSEKQAPKGIERRLSRIERELATSSEDQIFFGLVLSLLVFLVALPSSDLQKPFEEFLKFTAENSAGVVHTIKYASAACLMISSVARYYAVIEGRVRRSKTARALSIECLIMAWDAFLFTFVTSAIFHLSEILGILTIPIAALVAVAVFVAMARAENGILGFYASRYLIHKKDVTPFVSNFFQGLALSLDIAFFAMVILVIATIITPTNFIPYFLGVWVFLFALFMMLFARRRKVKVPIKAWRLRVPK